VRADQEAARRPPSTPGLSRRSGRIPALPYPPIKPSIVRQSLITTKPKPSTLEENCDKSRGVWGAEPPIWTATFLLTHRSRSR